MASKTSQISQEVTADQVTEFLETNPDFLDARPELLTKLKFSHHVAGATSLIERQIQVLREEQVAFKQRFDKLASNAELNQKLLEKIEKFTIELLDCRNAQPMVSRAHHLLKELFGLSGSQILIAEKIHPDLSKGVHRCNSDTLAKVVELVAGRAAFMGRPAEWLRQYLPDLAAGSTGSIAVVPLAMEQGSGYILLVSGDDMRFQNGMGSDFLTYIAALIGRLMERLE